MACRAVFRASRRCLSGDLPRFGLYRSCPRPILKDTIKKTNEQSSVFCRSLNTGRCMLGGQNWSSQAASQSRHMCTCKEIGIDEVVDGLIHHNKLYIDVRDPGELTETGSIGHSLNIPLKYLEEALCMTETEFKDTYHQAKPQPDANNIVVFCKSGVRAQSACDILHKCGYDKAMKFPGSMNEWEETLLGSTSAKRHEH